MDTVPARTQPEINFTRTMLTIGAALATWLRLVVLGRDRAAKDHQQIRRPLERV
jgi:hypothetical protein